MSISYTINKYSLLFSVLLLLALFGVSTICPRSVLAQNIITLNPNITYQTIGGWTSLTGSWLASAREGDPAYPSIKDTLLHLVVNDAGLNRIVLTLRSGAENSQDYWTLYENGQIDYTEWRANRYATVNDNADPNQINENGFHFSELDFEIDTVINDLRQILEANGESLYVTLEYVAFTTQITTGSYHHDNPDEYAEFILAAFDHINNKYGWVPDGVEIILEPDNVPQWRSGYGTLIGEAIVKTMGRLLAHGYSPEILAPSNTNMTAAITFFNNLITVPGAIQYVKYLTYHRYGGVSDQSLQTIASLAIQHGIRTAMHEWWSIGNGYQTLHKDLKMGRNSAWESGNILGSASYCKMCLYELDTSVPSDPKVIINEKTKFTRQYFNFIRKDAVRIDATSTNPSFDPLAFINKDGKYVVVVNAGAGGSFSVQNLPAGKYGIKYAISGQYDVNHADTTINTGQSVSTSIPSAGVITIYQKSSNHGSLQFSLSSYNAGEGDGSITITVTRTGGSSGAVSIDYAASDGSAKAGEDYTSASGNLTWADGDASDKTFSILILDDTSIEVNETVNLALDNSTGGAILGSPKTAILNIVDNEPVSRLDLDQKIKDFKENNASTSEGDVKHMIRAYME